MLTALSFFWTKLIGEVCSTDHLACGAAIEARMHPNLRARMTKIRLLPLPEVEDIVRFHLVGTGWSSYLQTGEVCGHRLPKGLAEGCRLPYPIYTPTTKAEQGHDEHLSADGVLEKVGWRRERLAIQVASMMADYAWRRGIILADTKFEFSRTEEGEPVLIDEKGTPDSSRFWDFRDWERAQAKGGLPPALDKQYVRDWGRRMGVDKRNPANPEDVNWVHSLEVPAEVVQMTTRLYRYIFWRLTGLKLESFQNRMMEIPVSLPARRIEVLIGSDSDLDQVFNGLGFLNQQPERHLVRLSIISCHRHPEILRGFAETELSRADVVIAAAGKAAALPGMVKSWLQHFGRGQIPVIGVALSGASSTDDQAARLSIENLPGQPVELDERGRAYFGADGFLAACQAAIWSEFRPKDASTKPMEIGSWNVRS